jgi:nicotinamide mononucleotide (NMN) deamidase PncC
MHFSAQFWMAEEGGFYTFFSHIGKMALTVSLNAGGEGGSEKAENGYVCMGL